VDPAAAAAANDDDDDVGNAAVVSNARHHDLSATGQSGMKHCIVAHTLSVS